MPGVHQRFVAMEGHMKAQDRGMNSRFDKFETMVRDSLTALQNYTRERDNQLADYHVMMAARLVSPNQFPRRQLPRTSPAADDSDVTPCPPRSPGGAATAARHHRMILKHHSIQSLWNEWYGLEDFQDKPVAGGIAVIETLYKSKWRKHFSGSEKKHFSRSQIVVRAINKTYATTEETIESTIVSFDVTYEEEAKFSMAKMASIVQNLGLVNKKKSRGKTQKLILPL